MMKRKRDSRLQHAGIEKKGRAGIEAAGNHDAQARYIRRIAQMVGKYQPHPAKVLYRLAFIGFMRGVAEF